MRSSVLKHCCAPLLWVFGVFLLCVVIGVLEGGPIRSAAIVWRLVFGVGACLAADARQEGVSNLLVACLLPIYQFTGLRFRFCVATFRNLMCWRIVRFGHTSSLFVVLFLI